MKKEDMYENLTQRYENLKEELVEIQNQFNIKREEFLKIQGALEALSVLESEKI
jgi:chaperonin cofactor prefoldin